MRVKVRIGHDECMLKICKAVSLRSTCLHRAQGAVITVEGRIVATGYNGSPPGAAHCITLGRCNKDKVGYCRAEGLHGESNAIASAAKMGVSVNGGVIYCIYAPCRSCCNLIKSAGIIEVVYRELYEGFLNSPSHLNDLRIKARRL